MKIKLFDTDLKYEHDIITRFGNSILKSFESMFETQEEKDIEIKELKEELHQKDKKLSTVTEMINSDNSLDRIKEFIEQLSSMMLSKNFSNKVDHKALTWLRGLFGEKIHQSFMTDKSHSGKKKRSKSRSKRKVNDAKIVFNEILEIITTMLDSSQNTSGDTQVSKLEYIKSRVQNELQKDMNKTIKPSGNQSFFSETPRSPGTAKNQSYVPFDDNSSVQSEITYSEYGFEQKFDKFFNRVVDNKLKIQSKDYDYLSMLKLQAQVIENLDDLQKHSDEEEVELPMKLEIKHHLNDVIPELSHEPEPTPTPMKRHELTPYLRFELSPEANSNASPSGSPQPQTHPAPEPTPHRPDQD